MGLAGHAVNTFPTPENKYGQWLLGVIKFAVGQRISALNAFQGKDTMVVAVPQGTGSGLAHASEMATSHTEVTPTEVKVVSEKVIKSETTVPIAGDVKKGGE